MDEAAGLQRADRISTELRSRPGPQAEVNLWAELAQLGRDHPAVAQEYWLPDILEELGRAYERVGRVDDALAAVTEAIEAGLRATPDPRTILAEINYRAGRREEAETLWAAVVADTPNDWWLYNNVAFEKADGDEWDDALEWIERGIRLALAAGDPDRLLGQMSDLRHRCLLALGLPDDELQERAESARAEPRPPAWAKELPRPEPHVQLPSVLAAPTPIALPDQKPTARIGLVWIPESEYSEALRRWPQLAADGGPAAGPTGPVTHRSYCRAMEQQLVQYASVAGALVVLPLRIRHYLAWCTEHDRDDATSESRAEYAAHRVELDGDELIAWPPGRKHDCWCGSGRRYKRCCGGAS